MVSPSSPPATTEKPAASMNAKFVGSGKETVVLAHGYGCDQSVWDKIAAPLAAHRRLLLFDWCFSGAVKDSSLYDPKIYSSYEAFADDLIAVVEEMGVTSCVYVGHSMAGMIGCIASVKRPDLFTRLVLLAASPRFVNLDDYEGGFETTQIEELFASIESNFEEWASSFPSLAVDANDPQSIEKIANCFKRMSPQVALSLAKTVFLGDYRHVLDKVVLPCNIIQTKNDVAVPVFVAGYMKSKIKGECEVEILDGFGHFPHLTAHLRLVELLQKILEL